MRQYFELLKETLPTVLKGAVLYCLVLIFVYFTSNDRQINDLWESLRFTSVASLFIWIVLIPVVKFLI